MSINRMNTNNVNIATRFRAGPAGPTPGPSTPDRIDPVNHVAWVGLALFFTAGFAVALSVFAGQSHMTRVAPMRAACSSPGA